MKIEPRPSMRSTASGPSGWTNWGRKAKKKIVSLGLSKLINTALLITDQAGTRVSTWATSSISMRLLSWYAFQARKSRYATPTYFNVWKASELAYNKAASPVMAATRCGTIPSVQPSAAIKLARRPVEMAAATVYSTPGPGVTTITKVVNKNATPTYGPSWLGSREHTRATPILSPAGTP